MSNETKTPSKARKPRVLSLKSIEAAQAKLDAAKVIAQEAQMDKFLNLRIFSKKSENAGTDTDVAAHGTVVRGDGTNTTAAVAATDTKALEPYIKIVETVKSKIKESQKKFDAHIRKLKEDAMAEIKAKYIADPEAKKLPDIFKSFLK